MDAGDPPTSAHVTRRYLERAAERIGEQRDLSSGVLGGVRADDVMRRTSSPRTAFYRWWEGQADMRGDLLLYLLTTEPLVTPPDGPTRDWRDALTHVQSAMRTAPGTVLRTSLLAYRLPARVELLLAWRTSAEIDALTRLLERLLLHAGRAASAPLTARDLAVALYLVADGSAHARRFTDDGARVGRSSAVVHAAESLLATCTRPRTRADRIRPMPQQAPPSISWSHDTAPALAAGTDIFHERLAEGAGLDDPFGDITVASLARAAGVARSSVSVHWPNQAALNLAIASLVADREADLVHHAWQRGLHAAAHLPPGARAGAVDQALALLVDAPPVASRAILAFTNRLAVDPVRQIVHDAWRRTYDRQVADAIAVLARGGGHASRSTVAELVAVLRVMLTSAARLLALEPTIVRGDLDHRGRRVSSLAVVADGIATHTLARAVPAVAG